MVLGGNTNYTRIALDKNANASICSTFNGVTYSHFDGKKWLSQPVAPDSSPIQFSCAVAVGPDGAPHLSWYKDQNADHTMYGHIKYADLEDGVWIVRTLDFDQITGKWHSMVLDSDGNPYVAYDSFVAGAIKYARWDGKNWTIHLVDSRNMRKSEYYNGGMGNCIRLDSQGKVHISYYTESAIKYAHQEGDRWIVQTVASLGTTQFGSWRQYRSTLVLDKQGFPHISYEASGTLRHAYWDGQQWRNQVVARSGADPLLESSMTIAPDDTIYIAYRDPDDGSLNVAIGHRGETPQTAGPEKKDKN